MNHRNQRVRKPVESAIRQAFALLFLILSPPLMAQDCQQLFNGESLSGWTLLGEADVVAQGGVITGTPVDTKKNTFLRTNQLFTDFDLSLEFNFEAGMFNSGVQFRSAVYTTQTPVEIRARDGQLHEWTIEPGRVYGYQADIDPSPRAWTGEIYDEAARGWLETFNKTPVLKAIAPDQWHTLRIRAEGSRIQTWLDDDPIADLHDTQRNEGFIALQVHGIYEPEQLGKAIMFRDLRLCSIP